MQARSPSRGGEALTVIYHPETETVEVPIEVIERLDQRVARIQQLARLLRVLIDEMKVEEQSRRRQVERPTN